MQRASPCKTPTVPWTFSRGKRGLLCLGLIFSLSSYGQTISLALTKASLEKAFREIEKLVPQRFVYTREMIDRSFPVSINVQGQTLPHVLQSIFASQPLEYSLDEQLITVRFKSVSVWNEPKGVELQGRVISEDGRPLSGATVLRKRTGLSVATLEDGTFALTDVLKNEVLIISNIGYKTREVIVTGNKDLEIVLSLLITSLDETVIVAYGTTTRRLNTGSISRVTAEQIDKQPVSNPLAALQGRMAGVNITEQSGLPGSNFSVLIRGRNSIQNGTSPLYVIDGIPFLSDADRLTQLSQISANSPFNTLNPADIQSVEVLKDADATAIYGSRGANGVVLITTKKGLAGKTKVDFNIYNGWGKTLHSMDYLNTQQYLQMRREAFANDGVTPGIGNAPDLKRWDTTRYVNWKERLIGGTATTTNAQLRLSGGAKGTTFSLSSNYYRETTVYPGDAYLLRKAVALAVNHHSEDNRFAVNIQTSYGSNHSKLYQEDLTRYINTVPNAPEPYDASDKLVWSENGATYLNPLASILQTYDVITDRLTADALLSYKIKGFQIKTSVGYNSVGVTEQTAYPVASQNPAYNPTGSASFAGSDTKTWVTEPQLEYNSSLGKKGHFQTLLGVTWQESIGNSNNIRAAGYTDDSQLNSTAGATTITSTVYKNMYYRYQSLFGRTTFKWEQRYLLNLTYRRDGSSRFGPGNRFANFGAVGAGWIFTGEKFVSKKFEWLSFGKLRGSYGINGNDQIGDYQYLDTWSATTYPYGGVPGLYPTRITNPDYGWEQKRNLEFALDLGLFKNRIVATVNWFRSRSDNQIILYTLPDQTGAGSILRNFPGKIENKGWEVELTATILTSNVLGWRSGFNLTVPRNKLLSFPGLASSSYADTYVEGKPLSTLIGYEFLGVNPQTGVYNYRDVNRDSRLNNLDYTVLGNTDPTYYGGLQNTFTWKNVELQALVQFISQQGRHGVYSNSQRYGQAFNQPTYILDHWTKLGETLPYQRYTVSPASTAWRASGLITSSSAVLTDASFARLKNASLSYSLPKKWRRKLRAQKSRLYVEGQNLITLTSYKGPDPESQSRFALPPLRRIVVGLQFTF